MALHLHNGSLKAHSLLEPVPKCKCSTYQPLGDDIAIAPIIMIVIVNWLMFNR